MLGRFGCPQQEVCVALGESFTAQSGEQATAHVCGYYSQVAEQGPACSQLHAKHPWGLTGLQPVHPGLQHPCHVHIILQLSKE